MKNYISTILFALLIAVSFNSCIDDNDQEYQDYLKKLEEYQKQVLVQYKADSILITNYLAENELPAAFDSSSGIYYQIVESGGKAYPNRNSYVTVKYKGTLLNGTVFDETKDDLTAEFILGDLISGWQIGLPKIGSGGKIILYLPSFYGYGTAASTKIPANSVLLFYIELTNFN